MSINIGLIGAGRMGLCHSGNLKTLPGVKFAGVYDVDPEKATAYAAEYGAKIYPDATSLAASPEIDLVMICSPTFVHMEGLMASLPTRKAIFCEKPLCRTPEELLVLEPLLKQYEGFFAIGFVRRYSEVVRKAKEIVTSGKLGRLICGDVSVLFGSYGRFRGDWFTDYRKSGGVMLDMLAHHADLQNYLIGDVESIYARGLMLDEKQELPADYVSATAVYRNGYISNMQCSWLRHGPSGNSMTVCGEKGSITISDSEGILFHQGGKTEKLSLESDSKIENVQENPNGDMYKNEMISLLDSLKNGKPPCAGAESAISAMKFCLGMMKSAETREIVTL